MLAVIHYDVIIYSDGVEIKAETIPFEQNDYLATFPQNLFNDNSSIIITVNFTVVDMIGQRSTISSVTVTINDTEQYMTPCITELQNTTTPSS